MVAVIIYVTYMMHAGLDLLNTPAKAAAVASRLTDTCLQHAKALRRHAAVNVALVATTVLSGAYVAGNDAGRAYNTFPDMNGEWVPSDIFQLTPLWRNVFENTATVQFDHRMLAYCTLASVSAMYYRAVQGGRWETMPRYTKLAFRAVAGMSVVQVGLGISTLLLYVPVPLAVVHQVSIRDNSIAFYGLVS